jgi:hypothetical protein
MSSWNSSEIIHRLSAQGESMFDKAHQPEMIFAFCDAGGKSQPVVA